MQTFHEPLNGKTIQKKTNQKLVEEAYSYCMELIDRYCHNYFFHNPSHTRWVYERSTYLAMAEWVGAIDMEDLQIAALFHDTGFSVQYAKNEYAWSQIARKWLESKNHDEDRIQKIEDIIMATVVFSKPKNLLQEIIQDADLDNIGTKAGFKNSEAVMREYREIANINISECAYWQFAYKIYFHYEFHTKTARSERTEQQKRNLKLVKAYCDMLDCEIPAGDNLEKIY